MSPNLDLATSNSFGWCPLRQSNCRHAIGRYSYIVHAPATNIPHPPLLFLNIATVGPILEFSNSSPGSGLIKLIGYNPDATSSGVRNGVSNSQHLVQEPQGTSDIGSSVDIAVKLIGIIWYCRFIITGSALSGAHASCHTLAVAGLLGCRYTILNVALALPMYNNLELALQHMFFCR